jgi:Domain of unknown function (DUF4398)
MMHDGARPLIAATLLALGASLAACASSEPPTAQMSAARSAIETAERSGATEHAPIEINNAREKLNRAEAASRQSKNDEAFRLAEQAQIDAQVAGAKAQTVAAQQALQQVREGTSALGTEQRPPTTTR